MIYAIISHGLVRGLCRSAATPGLLRPFVWLAFLQTPHFSTGNLQPAE